MIQKVIEKLHKADLVLIGIGEEMDLTGRLKNDPQYQRVISQLHNKQLIPFVERAMLGQKKTELLEELMLLAGCLENKNYFIVSTSLDGLTEDAGFKEKRVVQPCGNYKQLQCMSGCCEQLFCVPEDFQEKVEAYLQGKVSESELELPVCPQCGQPLVFNNVKAEHYVEAGYLGLWNLYTKWLQGTLNKDLCVLELGVGMKYPTVIRWPFEKVTFLNQKAEMFRVHSRLYQISEEISERAYGIHQEPWDFVKELSNGY